MEKIEIIYRDGVKNILCFFHTSTPSSQIILLLPAMGVRASYYQPFAEALCKKINVITADFRGQGKSSIRPSRKINYGYEDYILDLKEIIEEIEKEFPNKKIILMGHSLGGQISALFISRFPEKVNKLILVSSCSVYFKGWTGIWKFQTFMACHLFYPISKIIGHFPGDKIGFGGREARHVMRDWSLNGRTGKYQPINSEFNYEKALSETKINLLAISIETDNYAPKKAVENLINKFNSASKITHVHISENEAILSHFNWVKKVEPVISKMIHWINK